MLSLWSSPSITAEMAETVASTETKEVVETTDATETMDASETTLPCLTDLTVS